MKPWLLLPAPLAHLLSPHALRLWAFFQKPLTLEWNPLDWKGLHFPNRLGIAGGMDKDATHLSDWWKFGPGFIEVGTITPKPQGPNEGQILRRINSHSALWNRMGFPGVGAAKVKERLQTIFPNRRSPLFVNIGKNRDTPNERAFEDYVYLVREFSEVCDAFVVNISSPNTKNLRELQSGEFLRNFLNPIMDANAIGRPILLKLSPDMSDEALEATLIESDRCGIDGWILTNTTLTRPVDLNLPIEGGLSGAPLSELSKKVLQKSLRILGERRKNKIMVSVGGVMSERDVLERLEMGADLVEIFAALVFQGPGFFASTSRYANKPRP